MFVAVRVSFRIREQMDLQACSRVLRGRLPPQVLPSRRPKCPRRPQVKHSPELIGQVPGLRGYGVVSVTSVVKPWVFTHSACWVRCACLPASVSGWCGYVCRRPSSAALSACVGGALAAFGAKRLPLPPVVLVKGLADVLGVWCAGGAGLCWLFPRLNVVI